MQSDVLGPKLSCDQNRPQCLTLRDERTRQGMPDRLMKAKGRTMSMHADEELDEVVLPVKRSNNEGLSSAETVEGRASPKGNGGQTAAARTLRRDTASNGLAAVRRAARQSKTVRFTALLHHITTDLSTRKIFSASRMDTDRGTANTMRWTLSMPGFIGSK